MCITALSWCEMARHTEAESMHPGPEIILQKQYRPPIDKVVIEGPAGLIDAGETAEEAAVRELKEETGYVGVVSQTSPVMFNGRAQCIVLGEAADHRVHRPRILQYEPQNGTRYS